MSSTNRFAQLLELYLSGNISADEHEELFDLISSHKYDEILKRSLHKDLHADPSYSAADLPPHVAEEIVRNIFNAEKNTSRILPAKKSNSKKWWMIGGILFIILMIVAYWLSIKRNAL